MSQISKCPKVTVVLTYWEASGDVSELGYKSLLYCSSKRSYCIGLTGAQIFHVNSGGEKLSPESHTFVTFEEEEEDIWLLWKKFAASSEPGAHLPQYCCSTQRCLHVSPFFNSTRTPDGASSSSSGHWLRRRSVEGFTGDPEDKPRSAQCHLCG